jgi:m7GpppX diphosphatase
MTSTTPPETASKAEALIPHFKLTRLLNSDQAGRRISLLGTIHDQPALLLAERAAFDTSTANLTSFSTSLRKAIRTSRAKMDFHRPTSNST